MGFVVTLLSYAPPARADGAPFTHAIIEEAALEAGPWTQIATIAVAPASDPEHPEALDLTTQAASLAEGWYRVIWTDALSNESAPTAPVQNLSELAGGMRPTIADVAALLRARTKIIGGKEVGTFTESTRPTAEQVDGLIDEALDEVLGKVVEPEEAGSGYERRIRGAVRLYTAILIELSYFPESIKTGTSPAATYQALYASRMRSLIAESKTGKPEGEGGGEGPADAAYSFPADTGGLVGWSSRW